MNVFVLKATYNLKLYLVYLHHYSRFRFANMVLNTLYCVHHEILTSNMKELIYLYFPSRFILVMN